MVASSPRRNRVGGAISTSATILSASPPRGPGKMPQDNEKVPSSARDGKDVLGFDIIRRPWSSRDAMKEMDAAETFVLLHERGKDISSDDESGVDYSGIKSAADNPHEVLTVCSDKKTSAGCNSHSVVDIEEILSRSDALPILTWCKKDNQLDESLEF